MDDGGGPASTDGFDDQQFTEVVKWRNEVIKDGKEARTISGECEILNVSMPSEGEMAMSQVLRSISQVSLFRCV
jgi:hypothetical protein